MSSLVAAYLVMGIMCIALSLMIPEFNFYTRLIVGAAIGITAQFAQFKFNKKEKL